MPDALSPDDDDPDFEDVFEDFDVFEEDFDDDELFVLSAADLPPLFAALELPFEVELWDCFEPELPEALFLPPQPPRTRPAQSVTMARPVKMRMFSPLRLESPPAAAGMRLPARSTRCYASRAGLA